MNIKKKYTVKISPELLADAEWFEKFIDYGDILLREKRISRIFLIGSILVVIYWMIITIMGVDTIEVLGFINFLCLAFLTARYSYFRKQYFNWKLIYNAYIEARRAEQTADEKVFIKKEKINLN